MAANTSLNRQIIAAQYAASLGRTASAADIDAWLNTGQSIEDIATGIRTSPEAQSYASRATAPAPAPAPRPAPAPAPRPAPAPAPASTPSTSVNAAIQNAYQQYVGRPADAQELAYWAGTYSSQNPISQIVSNIATASRENAPAPAPAPATNSQYSSIEALYQDLMGRAPDASGLDYWTQQLMSPTSPGGAAITPQEVENFKTVAQQVQKTFTPEQQRINAPNAGFNINALLPGGTETGYRGEALDPSQSTLSPNFADYVYRMLSKGEQAANLPFQEYTGQRFAGPSELQQQAFRQAAGLTAPGQFDEATGIARLAAQRAGQTSYAPGQFGINRAYAPGLQQFQMSQPSDVSAILGQAARLGAAPTATAQQMRDPTQLGFESVGAERIAAPSLRDLQMQAAAPVGAERVGTRDIQAAQTGYSPGLQTFQMQAPSERVTAESFTAPGTAAEYMSPYLQEALAPQLREAVRQADIARGARGARYAQAGAFGGSRQAVEEAEAERNLQQRLADITGTGYQQAFGSAQEQFNREQQARQAAQQANIGTGLTVGQQNLAAQLGVQQLGTQTGLQTALANLTNEQQARVQSEANRLQASGMNQQQALQAALANQGVQQQAGIQNLSAALQTQGLGAQTGMEAQRLNQATGLQALLANQQAGMQTGQFNVQQQQQAALQNAQLRQAAALANQQMLGQYGLQQGQFEQAMAQMYPQQYLQAQLANQQAGLTTGQQNLQAQLATQQLGAGQNLQAQLANQQYGLQAQNLAEQSRQFGASLGQQGIGQQISAGQLMGGIGQQAGQYGLNALVNTLAAGAQQQQLAQQPLDFSYQQFQQSMQYPYQQGTYMSSLLSGLPLKAAGYTPESSGFAGALQGGLAGIGLYNAMTQG